MITEVILEWLIQAIIDRLQTICAITWNWYRQQFVLFQQLLYPVPLVPFDGIKRNDCRIVGCQFHSLPDTRDITHNNGCDQPNGSVCVGPVVQSVPDIKTSWKEVRRMASFSLACVQDLEW